MRLASIDLVGPACIQIETKKWVWWLHFGCCSHSAWMQLCTEFSWGEAKWFHYLQQIVAWETADKQQPWTIILSPRSLMICFLSWLFSPHSFPGWINWKIGLDGRNPPLRSCVACVHPELKGKYTETEPQSFFVFVYVLESLLWNISMDIFYVKVKENPCLPAPPSGQPTTVAQAQAQTTAHTEVCGANTCMRHCKHCRFTLKGMFHWIVGACVTCIVHIFFFF